MITLAVKREMYYRDTCEAWSPAGKVETIITWPRILPVEMTEYGKIQFYFGEKLVIQYFLIQ